MFRRLFALLSVVALVIACTAVVFAHGGGLDSKGGHYNRKTGEYHYHRKVSSTPPPQSVAAPLTSTSSQTEGVATAKQIEAVLTLLIDKGVITPEERDHVLRAGN